MKISVSKMPNRSGFRCQLRHPISGRVSSYGLGLDLGQAEGFAVDLAALCARVAKIRAESASSVAKFEADILELRQSPALSAYAPRAVAIIFGDDAPAARGTKFSAGPLADEDVGVLAARVVAVARTPKLSGKIRALLERYFSERQAALNSKIIELETDLRGERGRRTDAERELADLRRARNAHVSTTVGDVYQIWWGGI